MTLSVEERVRAVRDDLTLILAALQTDEDPPIEGLHDALDSAARRCLRHMAALRHLDALVLNTKTAGPVDDDD